MIFEKPSIEKPCINRLPRFLFEMVVTSSPLYITVDRSGVVMSEKTIYSSLPICLEIIVLKPLKEI